mmetsp:Transcript_22476/g.48958  ORF Transcript_22476/g.48958 Transcript_22476/m.48958 type:complete len:87 (+) Transcript_22476:2383-2643(+)
MVRKDFAVQGLPQFCFVASSFHRYSCRMKSHVDGILATRTQRWTGVPFNVHATSVSVCPFLGNIGDDHQPGPTAREPPSSIQETLR